MKKLTALLLSLLLIFPLTMLPANADEDGGRYLVEVAWDGITSGPYCEATVTLYMLQSSEPINDEFIRMWGNFRLVITDSEDNVISDEIFDSSSKSILLTDPGDYFCCVYSSTGELQGRSSPAGYEPLRMQFHVEGEYEPDLYAEMAGMFIMCCEESPDDHDTAFREYLAMIHSLASEDGVEFSLTECADYMEKAMADYPDQQYAALYNEFRANEGYAVMEVTPLSFYDPMILVEEDTFAFWSGECWRYIMESIDIPFNEDGTMYPYAEYISGIEPPDDVSAEASAKTTDKKPSDSTDTAAVQPKTDRVISLPLVIAVIAVAAIAVVVVVVLLRRKKAAKN